MKGIRTSVSGAILASILMGATCIATTYFTSRIDPNLVQGIPIDDLPMVLGSWQGRKDIPLDERSAAILQLDGAVKRVYRNSQGK